MTDDKVKLYAGAIILGAVAFALGSVIVAAGVRLASWVWP